LCCSEVVKRVFFFAYKNKWEKEIKEWMAMFMVEIERNQD